MNNDQTEHDLERHGPLRYDGAPRRRALIRQLVEEAGFRSSRELSRTLGVSEMTVRRDVDRLAKAGLLQSVHGGATPPPRDVVSKQQLGEAEAEAEEKRAIGAAAAELLEPHVVVGFDAGQHSLAVARAVDPELPLSVVTHSLEVASIFAGRNHVHLILLGGMYQRPLGFFAFNEEDKLLQQLRVDVLFTGTSAIRSGSLYVATAADADAKRALMGIADHVVLVAIARKFDPKEKATNQGGAVLRVAPLDDCETVVTDSRIRDVDSSVLDNFKGEIVVAELD